MGGVHLGPKIATNEWLPSPQPPRHHRLTTWIFMWNIPPSCHPGLLQALAINTLSHSLAHREGFSSSSFFLPDLPTPALPKTASFTSGLLAMTAALQPAKISKALSEPRGRPSVLGKTASGGKQWVLSLLWCRGTFQHLKYPTAFYYYYCPLSCMIHQTICESCACFPAGLSTFAIYFGQRGFQHFFFAFWEIALAFFHFIFSQQIFRKHSSLLFFRRLRPFSLSAFRKSRSQ